MTDVVVGPCVRRRAKLTPSSRKTLGKVATSAEGVIVGTQTVEQSLDIDADLIVTGAVPADVMLQRWRRLHRWDGLHQHQRTRPAGFETPRACIIAPGAWDAYLPEPTFRTSPPQGWRWVYPVLPVAATLELLEQLGVAALPQDQRRLVEMATHREALRALAERGDAWAAAWQRYVGAGGVGRQIADTALVDRSDQYGYGTTEAIATRLGDPTIMVRTPGLVSPLDGGALEEIGVPLRWWRGREPREEAAVDYDPSGTAMLLAGTLTMRYRPMV